MCLTERRLHCELAALWTWNLWSRLNICDLRHNHSHTCPDQFSLVSRISHDVSMELVESCIYFTGNVSQSNLVVVMPLDLEFSSDLEFQSRSDNQLHFVPGSKLVGCPCVKPTGLPPSSLSLNLQLFVSCALKSPVAVIWEKGKKRIHIDKLLHVPIISSFDVQNVDYNIFDNYERFSRLVLTRDSAHIYLKMLWQGRWFSWNVSS